MFCITISINQLKEVTTQSSPQVAVFGDGPVGYLAATALHYIYGIDKENLIVFGAIEEKLKSFESFATTHLVLIMTLTVIEVYILCLNVVVVNSQSQQLTKRLI